MFTKKPKSPFERYSDPTGEFSNRSLKLGEWYIVHKELLRKILIWTLVVWNVITISIGLFVWGKYLVYDYPRDEQQIAQMARTNLVSRAQIAAHLPTSLAWGSVQSWLGRDDTTDFGIQVKNNNERWLAHVTYAIDYGQGTSENKTETILPGEERYMTQFGVETSRGGSGAQMVIEDIDWERIKTRDVPLPYDFILRRIQFDVSNIAYVAAQSESNAPANRITFDIKNNSPFNFWDVPFVVVFKDGARITGLAPVTVDRFMAGETRTVEMASFVNNLQIQRVELQPVLNVFDDSVYLD